LILGIVSSNATDRGPALPSDFSGLLVASGFALLTFLVVFGLGWLASRATRDQLLLPWRPGWWVLPLGMGYSVGIRLAAGLGLGIFFVAMIATRTISPGEVEQFATDNRPQIEAVVDVNALSENPAYFWFTVTVVSFVVAGLREELWRAGFLAATKALWPGVFGSKFGQMLAVTLGAIIFGLGHLPMGILAVIMAGVLGLCLGTIMVMHRSIWPAVLAHGFFDATTFAILPWVKDLLEATQKTLGH